MTKSPMASFQPAGKHPARSFDKELAWWQRDPIYQIYPLSFQDTAGDGKGDLAGVLSRIEYLQWLGVGAAWPGPVFSSPMADYGYDITDFTGVDPLFGSLEYLDRLIDELHACELGCFSTLCPIIRRTCILGF